MPIRRLPTLLINQIAAGEVIERPASVVKELVENALDAGASRITVEIEEGGTKLIAVHDDGTGMTEQDLPLSVAAHATSKLESAEQLEAINTLGFRGEALASIASVSRLRITTRPTRDGQNDDSAYILEAQGDQISPVRPAAAGPGTNIEVRDLFFNTPARRRFLRTPPTELGHINDTMLRIAMVHPETGFTITHNGRKSMDLPPKQDRRERIIDLLGREMDEALLTFEHHDSPSRGGSISWGVAGMPSVARASGKFQYLCVNGRPIKDRSLAQAMKEAYRGLIPPDKFPMAVVMLELDPATVDVNVHPAKSEVRFRNPSLARGLVLNTIRQRLLATDLTPKATIEPIREDDSPLIYDESAFASSPNGASRVSGASGTSGGASGFPLSPESSAFDATPVPVPQPDSSTKAFVDYFKRMAPKQKGLVYQQVKQELQTTAPETLLEESTNQTNASAPTQPTPTNPRVMQIADSYIVTQDEQGLLIVDQHALHERVMFETFRKRIFEQDKPLESQRLLMPETIEADASRQSAAQEIRELLQAIGIELEPIGPRALAVHAFPSLLFSRGVEIVPFMNELLDKAQARTLTLDAGSPTEAALHEVLDMMSCKAAVKAGDHLSTTELDALLKQRDEIERSSNCPHGRPTTLRLSLKDLEKQFGR